MANTDPKDPYAAVKHAIRGSESSHQFFRNGRLIKNPNSSAKGPYQFIDSTWNQMNNLAKARYGKALNQNSPKDHDLAISLLLEQNSASLRNSGLPVNPGTLYLMHFKGDPNFVRQAMNNPNSPASNVFSSDEIKANGSILRGKTVGQAAQLLVGKVMKNMPQNRNSTNRKNAMASLTGPKNPNFDTAQKMPKAERDALIQEYKTEIRRMKKLPNGEEMINQYNKQMYDLGYMGFDESGNPKGFIAEGVRNQMTANQKKADDQMKAKRVALRAVGEVMRDGMKQSNDGSIRLDRNVAKTKIRSAINKLGKDLPKDIAIRKELNDLYNSIPSDSNDQSFGKGVIDAISGKEVSKKPVNQMDFFNKVQNFYSKTSGQKVDFFKEQKMNTGEGPGKTFSVPTNGKDINFNEGYFRFAQNNKNLNVETPRVPGGNVQDIELPNYDPVWSPNTDDAIPGIDDSFSSIGATGTPVPIVDDLNYYSPEWDNSKNNNKRVLDEIEKYRNRGAQNDATRAAELSENTTAENEKTQEQYDIAAAEERLGLGDPTPLEDTTKLDNPSVGSIIKGLPIQQLAMGAIGIALGKNMVDEELPQRDEQIDNALLSWIYEQKRIGEMGMNPTEEAAAKQEMADAYQMGVDNLTRNAAGNRNLILGNVANLDNINAKNMASIALKDAEIKQRASESYGRALEYVNNFNQQKNVLNNERKYQQAVMKQTAGGQIMAGAFKSMADALGNYSPPNSSENLYKVQNEVNMFGWSPNVADDGEGTNWGSKSWYQNKVKKAEETFNKNETLMEKFGSETPEKRAEFLKANKSSTRGQMLQALDQMYQSNSEENSNATSTMVDESGNIISQESTPSQATVPMSVTQIQKSDGTTEVATPYSVKGTDGTSANASVSPDQPNLVLPNKTTIFDQLNKKPIQIGTFGTSDGKSVDVTTDKTQKPIADNNGFGNFDANKAFAGMMGLDNEYDQASQVNQYYSELGENEDDRFSNIQNIIKKYS